MTGENRKPSKRCVFIKANGEQCRAYRSSDSPYCLWHDPDRAEERRAVQVKGGKQGRKRTLPDNVPNLNVTTAVDVMAVLAETASQVRRGDIDPTVANSVGYLLNIVLKAREQSVLETEVAKIKEMLETQRDLSQQTIRREVA